MIIIIIITQVKSDSSILLRIQKLKNFLMGKSAWVRVDDQRLLKNNGNKMCAYICGDSLNRCNYRLRVWALSACNRLLYATVKSFTDSRHVRLLRQNHRNASATYVASSSLRRHGGGANWSANVIGRRLSLIINRAVAMRNTATPSGGRQPRNITVNDFPSNHGIRSAVAHNDARNFFCVFTARF